MKKVKNIISFSLLYLYLPSVMSINFSPDKVNIIMNYWTSQNINSLILEAILKEVNIKTNIVKMSMQAQWEHFDNKDITIVQTEVWQTTAFNVFKKFKDKKLIVDAGSFNIKAREEWWYPKYIEKICPGLPDYLALKKCYKIFANTGSYPLGVFYTGPWPYNDEMRVKALGLKFKVVVLRNPKEIWSKLDTAYKKKKPILILNWSPNFIESKYNGRFVKFPKYHKKCITDKSWGVNPKMNYDCGAINNAWIKKIASVNISKKFPCAYKILQNMNLSHSEMVNLINETDHLNIPVKRVVWNWIIENKTRWKKWIPKECIKMNDK